jgi:sugar/nucleoside kinase (ribokinase family)
MQAFQLLAECMVEAALRFDLAPKQQIQPRARPQRVQAQGRTIRALGVAMHPMRQQARRAALQALQAQREIVALGARSSAATEGVGARRSATKSLRLKSVSCPIADTTGTGDCAIARTRRSSLKAHRSSSEPPPRASRIAS